VEVIQTHHCAREARTLTLRAARVFTNVSPALITDTGHFAPNGCEPIVAQVTTTRHTSL
jgi:hypothetical protein